ncbi:sulfotransferase [Oceanicoccus sp. KOV_DT_Chl]|uniref:sulfotransferase family protein n=1 Tax=Oceanicoccus sp. KOV_DT_Chl TaxID=1904639 RepID=UPI000C7BCAEC|nr:sulfotransferase [Oceanicoccus sp. KOV_DT_Chl]
MLFNFTNFLGFLQAIIQADGTIRGKLTIFTGGILLLSAHILNVLFITLDCVLFPHYKKTTIHSPIFIIGNARSGTTLLEQLLFQHSSQLSYQKSYEMNFPVISLRMVLRFLGHTDRKIFNGNIASFFEKLQQSNLGAIASVHPSSLYSANEDEALFNHTFHSPAYLLGAAPAETQGEKLRPFGNLTKKTQSRLMKYYFRCVQKHLFLEPGNKRYCSKHVTLLKKITLLGLWENDYLKEYFPDATVIYLIRDPLKVIPSAMNLMKISWQQFGYKTGESTHWLNQQILDEICESCEWSANAAINNWHGMNVIPLSYNDLINEPEKTVRSLYKSLHIELTPEEESNFKKDCFKASDYQSAEYSIQDFGFSESDILSRTQNYRQHFKESI